MRITRIFSALLILLFIVSCSKSSSEEEIQNKKVAIEGIWLLRDITNINLEGSVVPAEVSQEILVYINLIVNEGCELMTFEFKTNQTFILEQYDVNDFNPSEEEVEYVVNCTDIDTFTGTWDLQEGDLILFGEEDESSSFSISLEPSVMIMQDVPLGAILPINGEGNFVFEKLGQG